MAPCRSRPASWMLSAPAHIAATSEVTFAAGFAPPLLPAPQMPTDSRTSADSRPRSASRITGSSPASVTRFRSSNLTETVDAAWEDCISRVFSQSGATEL